MPLPLFMLQMYLLNKRTDPSIIISSSEIVVADVLTNAAGDQTSNTSSEDELGKEKRLLFINLFDLVCLARRSLSLLFFLFWKRIKGRTRRIGWVAHISIIRWHVFDCWLFKWIFSFKRTTRWTSVSEKFNPISFPLSVSLSLSPNRRCEGERRSYIIVTLKCSDIFVWRWAMFVHDYQWRKNERYMFTNCHPKDLQFNDEREQFISLSLSSCVTHISPLHLHLTERNQWKSTCKVCWIRIIVEISPELISIDWVSFIIISWQVNTQSRERQGMSSVCFPQLFRSLSYRWRKGKVTFERIQVENRCVDVEKQSAMGQINRR